MEQRNAIIESARIDTGDRGLLTAWLHITYGSAAAQGFGGYALYLPKDYVHTGGVNYAGLFIFRVMQIAGVSDWSHLAGKTIRVIGNQGGIEQIGHIVKEDWFNPKAEFEVLRLKAAVSPQQ